MINLEKCFIMYYQDEKFLMLTQIKNLLRKGKIMSTLCLCKNLPDDMNKPVDLWDITFGTRRFWGF